MADLKIDDNAPVSVAIGETLLEVSKRESSTIPYSCDGVPACARCKVIIVKGEEHISVMGEKEKNLMGNSYFITKERLACQTKIISDGDVEIKNISE
jgi:ferredoxin, 2Fe-2S